MKNKLKQIRTDKGLTQNSLADSVNVSTRNYQNYEYGKQIPNVYTAIKICKALNTTVEEVFIVNDQES